MPIPFRRGREMCHGKKIIILGELNSTNFYGKWLQEFSSSAE